MTMNNVQYGNASHLLRLEIPQAWDIVNLTGIDISIADDNGTELLAATAATLYTATTLNAVAAVGDATVTVAAGAAALSPGDRLMIAAGVSGPSEVVTVQSYNGSTKVASLKRELRYAHASGDAVYGLWTTYSLDASDTDTWTTGLDFVITWTPDVDDNPHLEMGEVVKFDIPWSKYVEAYKMFYPGSADVFKLELEGWAEVAYQELKQALMPEIQIDRIVDPHAIDPLFTAVMHYRILLSKGGDSEETEFQRAKDEYNLQLSRVKSSNIWTDNDQDGVKDTEDGETQHGPEFLGLERMA